MGGGGKGSGREGEGEEGEEWEGVSSASIQFPYFFADLRPCRGAYQGKPKMCLRLS